MFGKINYILDRKQKWNLIVLLLVILGGAFMELLGVSAILPLINLVLNDSVISEKWYLVAICNITGIQDSKNLILFLAAVLVAIYIIKNLYLIMMYDMQYRFIFDNQKILGIRMLNCYIKQPYLFHVSKNVAELQRNITNDVNGFYTVVLNVLQLTAEGSVCVALVTFLLFTDVTTTIVVAVLVCIFVFVFAKVFQKVLVKKGEKNRLLFGELSKWILQAFAGIKEIKVTNKERFFLDNYETTYHQFATIQRQQSLMTILPRPIMEMVCICGLLIALAVKVSVGNGDLKTFIPTMSVFAIAAFRMLPSFNRMTGYLGAIMFNLPSVNTLYEDLLEVEELQTSVQADQERKSDGLKNDTIQVEDVWFRYPTNEKWILKGINLSIKENRSLAIIGESGSGKTTLVDIILGILAPNKGKIYMGNVDISENIELWHESIGYIPQSIYLMDDTIEANIAFGIAKDKIDYELLNQVLEEAQLKNLVDDLPDGVKTEIGDRGVRLSGGQRQRIGIARALYRQPSILILDEATSALDNETEAAVMEAIDSLQGKKTLIIIAHRLSTIQNCDEIYEVKEGNIIRKK